MLRRVVVVLALALGVMGVAVSPALGAGDANTAVCPNEALAGFQSYLADCRAYEMVSPPFKGGFAHGVALAVSSDGSRVLANSFGVFAGTENDANGAEGAVYAFTRSGSGWLASAVGPPSPLFPASRFWAVSSDLGRTLWAVRDRSQSIYAEDLYVREADGSFVKIGPAVPPSVAAGSSAGTYQGFVVEVINAGASSDLSRVLFEVTANKALWPGDTTAIGGNQVSLYEYVGTGNRRPELVGVNAAGHLISDCETTLGSLGSHDTYNALSRDGETVFFTARKHGYCGAPVPGPEVNELYARLGGIETVAISEPLPSQCLECQTGVRASAEFQGASEDGSKVFFLTEQELLTGDTTMNLYEYDFDNPESKKIVRVSGRSATPEVLGVTRVSNDGSHVYFVARGVLTEGANGEGAEPTAGGANLYVFERDAAYPGGRLAFVATLSEEDGLDWSAEDVRPVQATPDGRFLVFGSVADLTPGDVSSQPQIFEYDALREKLVRVSTGAAGYANGIANADANGSFIPIQYGFSERARPPAVAIGLAVSADGSAVVFTSAGALAPGAEEAAAAGGESVYEYRSAGSISNGDVYLVSDGRTPTLVLHGMSASGGDVFFQTEASLSARDVDTQYDVYDARVDGGFPAPVASAACAGEACQGAAVASPLFSAPGSASAPSGGNLLPSTSGSGAKPKARPSLTRAQKLARALRLCRREPRKRRVACEARARKRFGVANRSNARGKGAR